MNLLSDELKNAIEIQIAHENKNSNIYQKAYNFLANLGLDNMAKFFKGESSGEIGHRDKFIEFATERNCPIDIISVEAVTVNFTNLNELAEVYLTTELNTTKRIKDIAFLAWEQEDLITYDFMMTMIKEQYEEENLALTFMDKTNNIGNSLADWQLFDNTFSM